MQENNGRGGKNFIKKFYFGNIFGKIRDIVDFFGMKCNKKVYFVPYYGRMENFGNFVKNIDMYLCVFIQNIV